MPALKSCRESTDDTVNIIFNFGFRLLRISRHSRKASYISKTVKFSKTCSVSSNWPATVPGHTEYSKPVLELDHFSVRPSVKTKTEQLTIEF